MALDPSARAARELARGDDRAIHDGRDLLEGHPKHIVEHERQSFRRLQLLEDDEERQTDRVGEHGVFLWLFVFTTDRANDRIGHMHGIIIEGSLPARGSRSQHVQADARHDRRQPSPQVFDTTHIRAAQSDPGFLDGVFRLVDRSEHAVRDRTHVRSVLFELLGELFRCGHQSHSSSAVRHCTDGGDVADVTVSTQKEN